MADELVTDPAEHLHEMLGLLVPFESPGPTLAMCHAFVRLLAAALVPAAKADAVPPNILDAIAASPLGQARLRQTGEAWPPVAKPEATGAPPERVVLREMHGGALVVCDEDDVRYYAPRGRTTDYVRTDIAEREAAELRGITARGIELLEDATSTETGLRREMYALRERITEYANERDAALARVAEVEAAVDRAGFRIGPHLHRVPGEPLSLWCHTCDRDGGYHWADCPKAQPPAQPPEVITSAAVESATQASEGRKGA